MTSCRAASVRADAAPPSAGAPKCVVWDLDDTLWAGTLLEGDDVRVRPGIRETLDALDARGVLHSIASRNDPAIAAARLAALGLDELFLYPQIGWGAKSASIRRIAEALNIGIDAIVFVDDQPFERDEVRAALPAVQCVAAEEAHALVDVLGLRGATVTEESRSRRALYRAEEARRRAEASFEGPSEAFLATLDMVVTIAPARAEDLDRAGELTRRTHQLNSTGRTYSRAELGALSRSPDHRLHVVSLEDRYGSYGRIGLALVERGAGVHVLKLLLMSCRVMSRGVGGVVLHQLMREAREAGVRFQAHFVPTGRNRQMLVTYRFAGFRQAGTEGDVLLLEHDLQSIPPQPAYLRVVQPQPR